MRADPTTVACDRCGAPCRISPRRDPDAKLLRHATPQESGLCADCAVAEWFVVSDLRDSMDPRALLLPHVQAQFVAVMRAGRADLTPAEIHWERVVANWHLPFVVTRRSGRTTRRSSPKPDPRTPLFDAARAAKDSSDPSNVIPMRRRGGPGAR